jgi:uncharacterized protein (DUF736 family)
MTAIGYVTKNDNGSYKGQLKIGARVQELVRSVG